MYKCWINGEEYWLHCGQWVPRRHFYDYGEEPIYLGPRHSRRSPEPPLSRLLICLFLGVLLLKVVYAR
jgi:hypothetical protein